MRVAIIFFISFFSQYGIAQHADTVNARKYLETGTSYLNESRFDSATFFLEKSLKLSKDIHYSTGIFASTTNLGVLYHRRVQYDIAQEYFLKALQFANTNKLKKEVALATSNLGELNVLTGKSEIGLAQLHVAEATLSEMNAGTELSSVLFVISECYGFLKNSRQQLVYLDKSENVCRLQLSNSNISNKDREKVLRVLKGILFYRGKIYTEDKEYEKALGIYSGLLENIKNVTGQRERIMYENEMARIYLIASNFDSCLLHTDNALAALEKDSIAALYMDVHELRSGAYEGLKLYDKALAEYKKFKNVNDSAFSEKTLAKIYDLQAKYETEEKDKQITYLAKEKRLYKWIVAVSIVAMIAALFYLFASYRTRRLQQKLFLQNRELLVKEKEEEKTNLKVQLFELEQMSLRAQMNPHFIFNSLNSIQHYVINRDINGANKYISMLGGLIRQTLHYSSKKEIKLSEELQYIKSYLELEKMRMQDKFDYQIELQEDVGSENIFVPPMILQPFIENAIRHGVKYLENKKGYIEITIDKDGDGTKYVITDNGVGREATLKFRNEFAKEHQSRGIDISEKRIALLENSDTKAFFEIIDLKNDRGQAQGTRVIIFLPD